MPQGMQCQPSDGGCWMHMAVNFVAKCLKISKLWVALPYLDSKWKMHSNEDKQA